MTKRADRPQQVLESELASRVPPHDLDAETACVSAAMSAWDEASSISWLRPEEFYSEANRRIWEAVQHISATGGRPDIVTVATHLRDNGRMDQVGGATYMAQIVDAAPSLSNLEAYANTVREKCRARSLILACQQTTATTYVTGGADINSLIVAHEQSVFALSDSRSSRMTVIGEPTRSVFDQIQAAAQDGKTITGIPTGFERYDRLTSGLHDGEVTIVAARPGMGKTSLVTNVGFNIAVRQEDAEHDRCFRNGVAMFSLEMPRDQVSARMLVQESRINAEKVRAPHLLTKSDWERLASGAGWLYVVPFYIDDTPAITIPDMRQKVRQARSDMRLRGADLRLILLDYIQLMRGSARAGNREQEIAEISRELKVMAKAEKVPVIALAQLSRAVETRSTKDKRPQLSDLRECLTGDSEIIDAVTGERVTLREIAERTRAMPTVHGLNIKSLSIPIVGTARVLRAWSTGVKPVFRVRTLGGGEIRATWNHPFFSPSPGSKPMDWRQLGALRVGDAIAVRSASLAGWEWDPIASIEPAGEEETFDLSVPGLHNFLVNGIFAHNSGAIEQDADNIVFIYRDDYYNQNSTEKGVAELIVAKQRNGPTRTVKVRWNSWCTRFDNLAPGEYEEDP